MLWEIRRFCSVECGNAAKREANAAARPSKPCAICGEPFSAPPSRLSRLSTCGKPECKSQYAKNVMAAKVSARATAAYASGSRVPTRGISQREAALWPLLRRHGWDWRHRWFDDWGCFEMDFADFARKINVEIDGPEHGWARRREADEARDAELQRRGWTIVRIPNAEVDADPAAVAQRILAL